MKIAPHTITLPTLLFSLALLPACNSNPAKTGATDSSAQPVQIIQGEFGLLANAGGNQVQITPTNSIPLVPGQAYGWKVTLKTASPSVKWSEKLTLPQAPASWGTPVNNQTLSADQRVSLIEGETVLDASMSISKGWLVKAGDPPGHYVINLSIEGAAPVVFGFDLKQP